MYQIFYLSWKQQSIFLIISVTLFYSGCLSTNLTLPPVDDDLLINIKDKSGINWSDLVFNGKNYKLSDTTARKLIVSLIPVHRSSITSLPDTTFAIDFSMQIGKNPLGFRIVIENDRLLYTDGKYFYEGGNLKLFKQLIDNIILQEIVEDED